MDRLHIHGEWSTAVVSLATSPFNGTLLVAGVTTCPDAESQACRSLGEAASALGIGVVQSADSVAVNGPRDRLGRPFNRVGVEGLLGSSHGFVGGTVVAGGVTLPKVVGLDLSGVATKSLLYNTHTISSGVECMHMRSEMKCSCRSGIKD